MWGRYYDRVVDNRSIDYIGDKGNDGIGGDDNDSGGNDSASKDTDNKVEVTW